MECIKCGHQNAPDQKNCEVCKLYLPSLERSENGLAHPIYERYLEFRHAVADLVGGKTTGAEFSRFLDDVSFKMAQKEQEIRQLEIPPDALDEFREELEVGFEGIDLYNKALLHFRQYVASNDATFAGLGLELAWQGNEKINEARLLNRKARQATSDEDFAEESATSE